MRVALKRNVVLLKQSKTEMTGSVDYATFPIQLRVSLCVAFNALIVSLLEEYVRFAIEQFLFLLGDASKSWNFAKIRKKSDDGQTEVCMDSVASRLRVNRRA